MGSKRKKKKKEKEKEQEQEEKRGNTHLELRDGASKGIVPQQALLCKKLSRAPTVWRQVEPVIDGVVQALFKFQ